MVPFLQFTLLMSNISVLSAQPEQKRTNQLIIPLYGHQMISLWDECMFGLLLLSIQWMYNCMIYFSKTYVLACLDLDMNALESRDKLSTERTKTLTFSRTKTLTFSSPSTLWTIHSIRERYMTFVRLLGVAVSSKCFWQSEGN